MGDDATKTVIKTLKAYLHKELPLDKDFFHELNSRGFLASNTAREIVMLADQGKQDCVWKLVTYMDQFYTEEMLQKLCAFLEEYAKPARPKLATIAARIRQEISNHKLQPVHELTPEDPQRGTSRARADVDVTVVKSVSDLMPYYMDMTAHLFELAAALEVVELSRALIDGSGTPQSKCLQILSHWLESTPSPTWALLCQKLRLVSSFKAVVHKIARDHNLPTAAHTVPGTFVPATFPPGSSSPEPPAPYTPVPIKHSLLSSRPEDKIIIEDLQTKVQQMKKDLYSKEEELRVRMEREVKVSRKGKGKAVTTDQEIEEKVSEEPVVKTELSPDPDIKTEPSPNVKPEPSSKRFKTAGPDYYDLTYEPPLEKQAKAEKHSLLSSLAEYKTLNDDLRLRVQYVEKDLHFKEEKLRVMEEEVKVLRKGKGKAVTTVQKPPRNWREMKCQKTLECGRWCSSVAVQGDVVCVGVEGRVLLFSKTSGAQFRELGSDQIEGPVYGVAFIDEDTIVVSDDKRLIAYTTKGQLVSTFDSGKAGFYPRGLTVGPDGHIFVCDWHNNYVCVFNVDGKLLSSFGSKGSGDGQFTGPRDVCMDGEGLLFISDMWNSRICVHSVEGAFIREFPTRRKPFFVAATHCNHLVVSSGSYSSDTVMIMTTSGQLVHEFGWRGSGPGQFYGPRGVAVDNEDCVYVSDSGNKRVQVY